MKKEVSKSGSSMLEGPLVHMLFLRLEERSDLLKLGPRAMRQEAHKFTRPTWTPY